ncbi:Plasmid stabilization system protein ParE [Hydrobacter penzbergensis]|uniref:Plasmid stabilization system protein ParE n=1 Tax=Hydrobacter penzbergensis TaxID=1235997 RepID=A0A8X8I983_9BACT|nr:type II toxin-antitoxin system RelE/ParE family toxin [Hydrobacter penzbergensis]SDW23456.1 Plasmid stabilization system protein ParE [Hydrobacter penzbergensis]
MIEEVVQDVQWTPSAKNSFNKIVVYLRREWTEKEVERFIDRTEKMINSLKCYPEMCRPSVKRKHVRIGILDKHTQIVYHYKPGKKRLEILLFWGMKQDPAGFKY